MRNLLNAYRRFKTDLNSLKERNNTILETKTIELQELKSQSDSQCEDSKNRLTTKVIIIRGIEVYISRFL